MRDEIIEDVKNFYEQYLYLKDIYLAYMDSSLAEKYSDLGKEFFIMATSALVESYMMILARMFDEDGKSIKVSELINKCKSNKDVFTNPDEVFVFLTDEGRKLKKDKDLSNAVEVIRHRRNRYLAHNDKEYFSHSKPTDKAIFDNDRLPSYEIWLLINWIKELLEKILEELKVDAGEMKPKYSRELAKLLPVIEQHQINPI
jgi:hypothetical protein